jgi:hypothetical protein
VFLEKHKKRLIPNLYQIVVNTKKEEDKEGLSFRQNLIFSKLTTQKRLKKFLIEDDRKF